ncbi:MAG: AMP-binding protein [Humidesulfovibrio sp.]|nr:AMP-binding protein [Humidesulfovibrio sp.]
MMNFAARLLLENAPLWPERIAARCAGRSLTYAELVRLSSAMGGLLRSRGIEPGGKVLIALPDSFSFLASFLGCMLGGLVSAPLNNRLRRQDYAECIVDTAPALVIASPGHEALDAAADVGVPALVLDDQTLEPLLRGVPPVQAHSSLADDVCVFFVTSGTTGHPKVVPHRQEDFFAVGKVMDDFFGIQQDDILLCSAKMGHAYGMFSSLIMPLQVGATVVLDPDKPTPENTLRLLRSEKVTVFLSVPVMYTMLLLTLDLADGVALGFLEHVRLCFAAGEVLPEAVFKDWRDKTGMDIWQGYGSTETMTFIIGCRPPHIVPGTAGRVLEPYSVAILDEDHRPLPSGAPGQIAVRGITVTRGYHNAPEWTRSIFTADGMLLTGDMGVERDGLFTVLGRMDDMFKVGGLWVSPMRVENALLTHPAVAQAAVTGGDVGAFTLVRAHVVLKPGLEAGPALAEDLRLHALALLPDYMAPTDIIFHGSLPMTPSGKIQRFILRQEANNG